MVIVIGLRVDCFSGMGDVLLELVKVLSVIIKNPFIGNLIFNFLFLGILSSLVASLMGAVVLIPTARVASVPVFIPIGGTLPNTSAIRPPLLISNLLVLLLKPKWGELVVCLLVTFPFELGPSALLVGGLRVRPATPIFRVTTAVSSITHLLISLVLGII